MAIYNVTKSGQSITGSQKKDDDNLVKLKAGADDAKINITQRGSGNQDFITNADDGNIKLTRQKGKARTLDTGDNNVFNKLDNALASSSQSIFSGNYTQVNHFAGSKNSDTLKFNGSQIKAKGIDSGAGNDTLTVTGSDNEVAAKLGTGDDVLNVRAAEVKVDGQAGNNRVFLGEGTTGSIKNFKKIYAGDTTKPTDIASILTKNADGTYRFKDGDTDVNLGPDGTAMLRFQGQTEADAKSLADWLGGGGTTPPPTGEINQADLGYVGGDDTVDGKEKKLNGLDLAGGKDKLTVNKNSEGTASGGGGSEDAVILMDGLAKYDVVHNTDGSYKLTHKDTSKILNLSDFEKFQFGNGAQEIDAAELQNWIAPGYGDTADTPTLAIAANALTKIQDLKGGNDFVTYNPGATGYTFIGGAGTDTFDAQGHSAYQTEADLLAVLSRNGNSEINFGGSKINADFENFNFKVNNATKSYTWAQLLALIP